MDLAESEPTGEEIALTDSLVRDKYASEDWLFARTPQHDANATALLRTPAGLVRLYLALQGDTIKSALFTGDFNDIPPPIARFEAGVKWARLARRDIEAIAESAFVNGTGLDVSPEEVVSTVLEAGGRAKERSAVSTPARNGSCYFPDDEEAQ
jgi:hypothetical protein